MLLTTPRSPDRSLKTSSSDHAFALAVTLTLSLLIAIGVPLAAVLPPKYVQALPVSILVPLYIYPDPGSWDWLYNSAVKYPDLNFTAIVNPCNGPCNPPYPGGLQIAAIQQLNKFPNIQTVGYIDVNYTNTDNGTVNEQIKTYAGWTNTSGLAIHGIYFDRTPVREAGDEKDRGGNGKEGGEAGRVARYMRNISATVKHVEGFVEPTILIHNPGMIPDVNLTKQYESYVDITVVFEGAWQDLPTAPETKKRVAVLGGSREQFAFMIHDTPMEIGRTGIRKVINNVRKNAQYVFVTNLGDKWEEGVAGIWWWVLAMTW
ncbi:hypothetical protein K491DRAFT_750755 [Lophiostoma macrostomum CBS 122681]|uniref:Spherulation-specific family 4 n=1 Tax=Lophiostoma macrostomum CBS 122681 TaxID=1314788 RepID=A0A6A6TLN5_9PLEO|nr:hypothetical protein K491DRAFT_750755 [Lophiostoma macrostomum CBS 122681]